MTTSTAPRRVLVRSLLAAASVAVAACSGPTPAPAVTSEPPPGTTLPATAAPVPTDAVPLTGWKLTLPVAGPSGGAALVDPARPVQPWLTQDPGGGVTFWAPAGGATTAHSTHARTELDSLENFAAGTRPHLLTASLSVTQVPAAGQDVILGQIHGADTLSSVPFVMLHYRATTIDVVVKRERSGSASDRYTLLNSVPLGARFGFTIRDNGDDTTTFTATSGTQQATRTVPVPDAFRGATVRFQVGAYQQSSAAPGTGADDDGARVTYQALRAGPG